MIRAAVALAALLAASTSAFAEDIDRVTMRNGDFLTGDIKRVEYGSLRFKTTATDTIEITWDNVARLTSPDDHQVELDTGERYLGPLEDPGEDRMLAVATPEIVLILSLDRVVKILPIKRGFWGRIDGNVAAGFSFTESSDVSQFTLSGNASVRTPKHLRQVSFSTIVTDQETGTTERGTGTAQYETLMKNRYYNVALLTAEKNDELGIDRRIYAGGGLGRRLVQRTHTEFKLAGGALYVHEDQAEEDASQTIEAFALAEHQIFRFTPTDTVSKVTLIAYQTLTDASRLRGELDATVLWEIVKDFTWSLTLYGSYTSSPPEEADRTDYGVTASLGWTF